MDGSQMIVLSQRRQIQKSTDGTTLRFHLYKIIGKEKLIYNDKKQSSVCPGLEGHGVDC